MPSLSHAAQVVTRTHRQTRSFSDPSTSATSAPQPQSRPPPVRPAPPSKPDRLIISDQFLLQRYRHRYFDVSPARWSI